MKVVTVVGARPQFIKAAPVSRALAEGGHEEVLVRTGQHYDPELSDRFLDELALEPAIDLGIGSEPERVGKLRRALVPLLEAERPDRVIVYGDTDSTRAGAVAASESGRMLAHVEAGLRSGNLSMPEERNRVIADHCAHLLFCPDDESASTLVREGVLGRILVTGDVMADALSAFGDGGRAPGDGFVLATIHRAENTDDGERLTSIVEAIAGLGRRVVFPVHPRTRDALVRLSLDVPTEVEVVEPLGYRDMIAHLRAAHAILTDSGGIQKEAAWVGVPCITIRSATEWRATVRAGWNRLVPAQAPAIIEAVRAARPPEGGPVEVQTGAARLIVAALEAG